MATNTLIHGVEMIKIETVRRLDSSQKAYDVVRVIVNGGEHEVVLFGGDIVVDSVELPDADMEVRE